MLSFFRRNPPIPEEQIDWIFEVYEWLLAHTGGMPEFVQTQLVTPTEQDFPLPTDGFADEDGLARHLFELTKRHARMDDWPCKLEPHENAPQADEVFGHIPFLGSTPAGAAGTFRVAPKQEVVITYAAASVSDPMSFVGTMAHELSHYLMGTIPVDPPGGPEAEEPATDLCAVFLGFGVFTANSAVRFEQFQDVQMQGWSIKRQGYLSEQALSYALALFCALHPSAPANVTRHLDANPRSYFRKALRDIGKQRVAKVQRLRDVKPVRR